MTQLMNLKKAKLLAAVLAAGFLMIHIAMLLLFYFFGVKPMMYFNIGSVVFYIAIHYVIHRGWFRVYTVAVYLEVVLHMFMAVYYTGWESNFQITLVGMSMLVFYAEYVGRYMKIPVVNSLMMCMTGAAAYLISCAINYVRPAPYSLPVNVNFALQIFWGVTVFLFTLAFLYIFVRLSASSQELLTSEVRHDQLTGLPNRYFITDYLDKLAEDDKLEGHWLAMVDIDDFKVINDSYGHNCGDFVLREIANILRESDINMQACRWGGEEFILTGYIDKAQEECVQELEELRKTIMAHDFRYEALRLRMTITLGVAFYQRGQSLREWIGTADRRMYLGKSNGKNQVVA